MVTHLRLATQPPIPEQSSTIPKTSTHQLPGRLPTIPRMVTYLEYNLNPRYLFVLEYFKVLKFFGSKYFCNLSLQETETEKAAEAQIPKSQIFVK